MCAKMADTCEVKRTVRWNNTIEPVRKNLSETDRIVFDDILAQLVAQSDANFDAVCEKLESGAEWYDIEKVSTDYKRYKAQLDLYTEEQKANSEKKKSNLWPCDNCGKIGLQVEVKQKARGDDNPHVNVYCPSCKFHSSKKMT